MKYGGTLPADSESSFSIRTLRTESTEKGVILSNIVISFTNLRKALDFVGEIRYNIYYVRERESVSHRKELFYDLYESG